MLLVSTVVVASYDHPRIYYMLSDETMYQLSNDRYTQGHFPIVHHNAPHHSGAPHHGAYDHGAHLYDAYSHHSALN